MSKNKESKFELHHEVKKDILVICIFAIALLSLLAIFDLIGKFGIWIDNFWQMIFGWGWWLLPFLLIFIALLIINKEKREINSTKWIGLAIFQLTFSGLLELFLKEKTFENVKLGEGGGLIGYIIALPLENIASFWGALIILLALLLISIILFFETSISSMLEKIGFFKENFFNNFLQFIKLRKSDEDYDDQDYEDVGFEQKEIDALDEEENVGTGRDLSEDEESENPLKQKTKKKIS